MDLPSHVFRTFPRLASILLNVPQLAAGSLGHCSQFEVGLLVLLKWVSFIPDVTDQVWRR